MQKPPAEKPLPHKKEYAGHSSAGHAQEQDPQTSRIREKQKDHQEQLEVPGAEGAKPEQAPARQEDDGRSRQSRVRLHSLQGLQKESQHRKVLSVSLCYLLESLF